MQKYKEYIFFILVILVFFNIVVFSDYAMSLIE